MFIARCHPKRSASGGLIDSRLFASALLALGLGLGIVPAGQAAEATTAVLGYHASPERTGNFVVPGLTIDKARSVHIDTGFHAEVKGAVYAQPLYWKAAGAATGRLFVATEDDVVYALDAATGQVIWQRSLGQPVPRSSLPCGDINPLGITGTPVIDPESQTLFVDAAVADQRGGGFRHLVFGLSLDDGSIRPGWPVDVAAELKAQGHTFDTPYQGERGALVRMDGTVYVPYGGHYGDCGPYHGWVVAIPEKDPSHLTSWESRGRGAGIWAPGGISSDGKALFAVTGNTLGVTSWSDGEAVFRFSQSLATAPASKDYFAPTDWLELDRRDADLGGTNALPFDLGDKHLILALGKDGRAYVLDRNNLGGLGGALADGPVSTGPIRTGPAAFPVSDRMFIAFQGAGAHCPDPARRGELTVLAIAAGSPPSLTTAWCGALRGAGSPIVTTTDGKSDPVVWILGAEGDNRLHGYRGDTGEPLFTGGGNAEAMRGLRHFQTLIVADGRFYVGADGRVYAFAF